MPRQISRYHSPLRHSPHRRSRPRSKSPPSDVDARQHQLRRSRCRTSSDSWSPDRRMSSPLPRRSSSPGRRRYPERRSPTPICPPHFRDKMAMRRESDRDRQHQRRRSMSRRSSSDSWSPDRIMPSPIHRSFYPRRSSSPGRRRSPERRSPTPICPPHLRDKMAMRRAPDRDRTRRSPPPFRQKSPFERRGYPKVSRKTDRSYPIKPPPIGRYNSRRERDDSPERKEFVCKFCELVIYEQKNYAKHHQYRTRHKRCPSPAKADTKRSRRGSPGSLSLSPSPPRRSSVNRRSPTPSTDFRIGQRSTSPSSVNVNSSEERPDLFPQTSPTVLTLDDSNFQAKSPLVFEESSVTSSKGLTPSPPPVSPPRSPSPPPVSPPRSFKVSPPQGNSYPQILYTPEGSLMPVFNSYCLIKHWPYPEHDLNNTHQQPLMSSGLEPPQHKISLPPPVPLMNMSNQLLPTDFPTYPHGIQTTDVTAGQLPQPVPPPEFQRQSSLPASNTRDPRIRRQPPAKIRVATNLGAKLISSNINIASPPSTPFDPKKISFPESTSQATLLESTTTDVHLSMPAVNFGPPLTTVVNKFPHQSGQMRKLNDTRLERFNQNSPQSMSPDQSSPRQTLEKMGIISPKAKPDHPPPLLLQKPSQNFSDLIKPSQKVITDLGKVSQKSTSMLPVTKPPDGKVSNKSEQTRSDNSEKVKKLPAAILEELEKEEPRPKPISIVEQHNDTQSKLDDIFDKRKKRRAARQASVSRRKTSGESSSLMTWFTDKTKTNVEKIIKSFPVAKKIVQTKITIPIKVNVERKKGDQQISTENVKNKCGYKSTSTETGERTKVKQGVDLNIKSTKLSMEKPVVKDPHLQLKTERSKPFEAALRTDGKIRKERKEKIIKSSREKDRTIKGLESKRIKERRGIKKTKDMTNNEVSSRLGFESLYSDDERKTEKNLGESQDKIKKVAIFKNGVKNIATKALKRKTPDEPTIPTIDKKKKQKADEPAESSSEDKENAVIATSTTSGNLCDYSIADLLYSSGDERSEPEALKICKEMSANLNQKIDECTSTGAIDADEVKSTSTVSGRRLTSTEVRGQNYNTFVYRVKHPDALKNPRETDAIIEEPDESILEKAPNSEEEGTDYGEWGNSYPKSMEEGLDNRYYESGEVGMDVGELAAESIEDGDFCNRDYFMDIGEDNKKPLLSKILKKKVPKRDGFTRLYAKRLNCDTFSWELLLDASDFVAAPVSTFRHAPLADSCKNSVVGMEVDVKHADNSTLSRARIEKMQGYMAMLRLVYSSDEAHIWMNILSPKIQYPIGWCDNIESINMLQPVNFYPKESERVWEVGMKVELIDRKKVGQIKVATVAGITGKRLHLIYTEKEELSEEFWCHQDSPLLHPVGWAGSVGHAIQASREYLEENYHNANSISVNVQPSKGFTKGMKLEVVDPIRPGNICVATVKKVLKGGWIMVGIDCSVGARPRESWFCYHATSQHIFPPGFCEEHDLLLDIPKHKNYLKSTKSIPAPAELFSHRDVNCNHKFVPGMKVEAADLIQPDLICPATIKKVVGRLLKVHFDGWGKSMDQWMDCRSLDIYPVGWAEVVGHILQKPENL